MKFYLRRSLVGGEEVGVELGEVLDDLLQVLLLWKEGGAKVELALPLAEAGTGNHTKTSLNMYESAAPERQLSFRFTLRHTETSLNIAK